MFERISSFGFLDVLGQRERFRELRLPKTAEEETQVTGNCANESGPSCPAFTCSLRALLLDGA
jgi:hypothetical protein